jgi:DNA polymerase IV
VDVRAILHVDMDAFFASVEQLDDPALRGRPVVVGARSPRGVVAAASYEVRPFGVRSAMPMMEALRRCPEAVVVPPRGERYAEVSARVFAIFGRYTPLVEGLSLDEAFLDVTGSRALFGDGEAIARQIRSSIRDELGLTASAGVAPSKFVAKIASDQNKPDGLTVVRPGEVESFLRPLPVERMWGVGPVTAERLRGAGIRTFAAIADMADETLERLLGGSGRGIRALARGIDERPVIVGAPAKSIGAEQTFERDLHTHEELLSPLLAQSAKVAARLLDSGLWGGTVTVKLKGARHELSTRQLRLPRPVADTDAIYEAAKALLLRFPDVSRGIRLTGVAVGDLRTAPADPELFADERGERRARVEAVTAELRARFGEKGVVRGTLVGREELELYPGKSPSRGRAPGTR